MYQWNFCDLREKINAAVVTVNGDMLRDIGDKTGSLYVFCTTDCADTDSYCGCQTTLRDILDTKKVLLFCFMLHDLFHLE
jgi:hypothetical protein